MHIGNRDKRKKKKKCLTTRAFFDQGAQRTFISQDLVDKLRLKPSCKVRLELSGFLGKEREQEYDVVKPYVRLGRRVKVIPAVVIQNLPSKIHTSGLKVAAAKVAKNNRLADQHLDSDTLNHIGIIIGSDNYSRFITGVGRREGIDVLETPGGLAIFGPIPLSHGSCVGVNHVSVYNLAVPKPNQDNVECHDLTPRMWDLVNMGISPNEEAVDDSAAYDSYLESVQYVDKKYWVRLPWKPNAPVLPTNYQNSKAQLTSQLNKLRKTPEKLTVYNRIIQEQLKLRFIENCSKIATVDNQYHYLPHHGVAKDSISTPLRLVYNASSRASSEEASLNQCLMRGPNLTEKLLNTLARFRTEKYAYSADISKAFLRLGLQECDRDFTRFLWSENPHDPNARLVSYRFKSVLFGATSSPFLLQVTLDLHFKTSKGQYREEIRRNMYVDNLLGTTSCEQKLIELYTEANFELKNADMPLTAWSTNSPALTKQLQTDLKSENPFSHHQNILGMNWDITTDSISIKALEPNVRKPTTKRELLSRVSSLFDPLGLVSPLTIQGKLLVQAAWQLNVSWDQRLPEAFMEGWQEIEVSLASAERFNFPRTVVHSTDHPELHIFCDASNKAYGACAYIITDNNSNILTSKAKVAPLKTRTLPQLELMALLVGARLAKYIKHTLDNIQFSQTYLWSDNEACIQWVKNNRSQITFVKNRVAEIRELTPNIIIQHVSSKENPADLLTRGVTPDVLEDSTLWFEGPIWLSHKAEWPIQKEILVAIQTIGAVGTSAIPCPLPILVIAHFSSYQKLINVTRQVFKFLLLIKPNLRLPSPFMYWIRQSQEEYYPGIFKILNKEISPLKSDLNLKAVIDLGLYEDKDLGVLRSRGRLKHADLSSGTKFPLLLPNKSKLAELLLSATHEGTHH